MVKKIVHHIIYSPIKDNFDRIHIMYLYTITSLVVNYVPLKYYYTKFFVNGQDIDMDMQPFRAKFLQIIKIGKFCPFKVTCLMECMVLRTYFRKYKILIPISLGIRNTNESNAHAWTSFTDNANSDYNIITNGK